MGTDNLETFRSTLEASGGHRSPPPPGNVKLPFGRWVRVTGQDYVSKHTGIRLLVPERL